jgi:Flp pilus assembly protein TadD
MPAVENPGGGSGGGGVLESSRVAYEDVLEILAMGSTGEAAMALVAAEKDLGAEPGSDAAKAVERAEMKVLDDLAHRDAEALLPALMLHLQLFRIHAPQRRYSAAGRHIALAEQAAALYALGSTHPGSHRVAAEALTVLGSDLMSGGHRSDARRVLTTALELMPEQPEALLLMACDRERDGDYEAAVAFLQRLRELRPDWLEARIRLAVNLARAGAHDEATSRFRALCEDPVADWAAILSCEELARMHLAAGETKSAQAVLAAAIDRFPDSERLRLAFAYAVDRGGSPSRARALVEKIAEKPAGDGETPRRRYNRGLGTELVLELSARFEALAAERSAALHAALSALTEDEEAQPEDAS